MAIFGVYISNTIFRYNTNKSVEDHIFGELPSKKNLRSSYIWSESSIVTNLATILIKYRWNQEGRINQVGWNPIFWCMKTVKKWSSWDHLSNTKNVFEAFWCWHPAISKHLKNIFDSGELIEDRTISKMKNSSKWGERSVKKATTLYKHLEKDKHLCNITILQFVILPDTVCLVSFNWNNFIENRFKHEICLGCFFYFWLNDVA